VGADASYLAWRMAREVEASASYEYQVEAKVAPTDQNLTLESQAVVNAEGPDGTTASAQETVTVAVFAKGRYLQYLPAIYQSDDFMGRFLMLFESFWGPIEQQIDNIPYYLDPDMAPPDFVPWLASWLDLSFDQHWSEEKRRRLLRRIASLYRKRGTKAGLQEYLEIFSGGRVEITEHRSGNFRLGPETRLGPGIALGTDNVPHRFTVIVRLPPASPTGDGRDQEVAIRRMLETIIETEKPAHTSYTLQIETISPTEVER
jgi:phage tail-like protein